MSAVRIVKVQHCKIRFDALQGEGPHQRVDQLQRRGTIADQIGLEFTDALVDFGDQTAIGPPGVSFEVIVFSEIYKYRVHPHDIGGLILVGDRDQAIPEHFPVGPGLVDDNTCRADNRVRMLYGEFFQIIGHPVVEIWRSQDALIRKVKIIEVMCLVVVISEVGIDFIAFGIPRGIRHFDIHG